MGHKYHHNRDVTTVYGRRAASRRRVAQLIANYRAIAAKIGEDYFYPYAVTLKVLEQLTVEQHKELWTALWKEMVRLGVVAAWEREITRANKIDYHLVVRSAPENFMRNRARKLRESLHKITDVKLNIRIKIIPSRKDCNKWIRYVSKVVIAETKESQSDDIDVVLNTKLNQDIYARKRVYFLKAKKGQPKFHTTGDFGKFFELSPTQQDKAYRAKKKQRDAKRAANPDIEFAAKELADLTAADAIKIEDKMYGDVEAETDPIKKAKLVKQNKELALQYHGGEEEYADFLRTRAEQREAEEQRRKLRQRQPRTTKNPKIKKPWHPDDIIESITTGLQP